MAKKELTPEELEAIRTNFDLMRKADVEKREQHKQRFLARQREYDEAINKNLPDKVINTQDTIEKLQKIQRCADWFYESCLVYEHLPPVNWDNETTCAEMLRTIAESADGVGTHFSCRAEWKFGRNIIVIFSVSRQSNGDTEVQVQAGYYGTKTYLVPKKDTDNG